LQPEEVSSALPVRNQSRTIRVRFLRVKEWFYLRTDDGNCRRLDGREKTAPYTGAVKFRVKAGAGLIASKVNRWQQTFATSAALDRRCRG